MVHVGNIYKRYDHISGIFINEDPLNYEITQPRKDFFADLYTVTHMISAVLCCASIIGVPHFAWIMKVLPSLFIHFSYVLKETLFTIRYRPRIGEISSS